MRHETTSREHYRLVRPIITAWQTVIKAPLFATAASGAGGKAISAATFSTIFSTIFSTMVAFGLLTGGCAPANAPGAYLATVTASAEPALPGGIQSDFSKTPFANSLQFFAIGNSPAQRESIALSLSQNSAVLFHVNGASQFTSHQIALQDCAPLAASINQVYLRLIDYRQHSGLADRDRVGHEPDVVYLMRRFDAHGRLAQEWRHNDLTELGRIVPDLGVVVATIVACDKPRQTTSAGINLFDSNRPS